MQTESEKEQERDGYLSHACFSAAECGVTGPEEALQTGL